MVDALKIASATRVAIVAAAGCGKTHLVCEAVGESAGRQLVLTHTHAGVDALRRRFQTLSVSPERYHLSTLAGFGLRLASAYPMLSGLTTRKPKDTDWEGVYHGAAAVLGTDLGRAILQASFAGAYVDEYQDCNKRQHSLVLALAATLPCRVFGDPLQAIFDFGEPLVDWQVDVAGSFEVLNGPNAPRRWEQHNPAMGRWLSGVREKLLGGEPVTLDACPPGVEWRPWSDAAMRTALWDHLEIEGRTTAILDLANRCHRLAKLVKGFKVIEPVDSSDLFASATLIEQSSGPERVQAVVEFAKKCFTRMGDLDTVVAVAKERREGRKIYKNQRELNALVDVREQQDYSAVSRALHVLATRQDVKVYRRELARALVDAMDCKARAPNETLAECCWLVRNKLRSAGRALPRHTLSRTVLVKGLEFENVVVLDADKLCSKDLYVALTRASRRLTVLSRSRTLTPVKRGGRS